MEIKVIVTKTVWDLSTAVYDSWMNPEQAVKLMVPRNLTGALEELMEESEDKEMETNQIDWEFY